MTKVTLNEGAQAPAAADDDVVTDSRGRRLKIKRPDILQESRLVKTMGEASTNQAYMTGYVLPAAMVVEIDGEAVQFPNSQREVDASITRLGREGIEAVLNHFISRVGDGDDAIKDAAKN
jgi:hypothetical protein